MVETTDKNPFGKVYWPPPYGAIQTPIDTWFKYAKLANYSISILRIKKEVHEKLNLDKMRKEFLKLEGTPYGYHNLLYNWIDTIHNNYPQNLDGNIFSNPFMFISAFISLFISAISPSMGLLSNQVFLNTGSYLLLTWFAHFYIYLSEK